MEGVILFMDWDPGGKWNSHLELRAVLGGRIRGRWNSFGVVVDLDAPDLAEAVERTLERTPPIHALPQEEREAYRQDLLAVALAFLNVALYLSQPEPDLSGVVPPGLPPVKRVKGKVRVFPPESTTLIPIGWRWGRAIRMAKEAAKREREEAPPTGRTVTPHVRRAYWHLYWTGEGAKKDPSKAVPVVRWVPATLVGRNVPFLLKGIYGTRAWMAELGRRGGKVKNQKRQ